MAEPLQPSGAAAAAPEKAPMTREEAAVASVTASRAPQEQRPVSAPAPVQASVTERTLFDDDAADDELPPPAYRPQVAEAEPLHVEDEASNYVAPRPRPAGTPSPEAMARLQAAVNRAPGQAGRAVQQQPAARPQAPAPQPRMAEKPRFGINSLLNRMAGHSSETSERVAPSIRPKPQMRSEFDDDSAVDPEQERVEIPAFLRRQAN
jgi:cell division protein FtsZ